jgi:Skp family chaperone for outer membrane proteins
MSLPERFHQFFRTSPVLAAALLGGSFIAASTIHSNARPGAPTTLAPEPTRVGLVDLAKLMNSMQELKDRNDLTLSRGKSMQEDLTKLADQIKAIDTELKDVIPKDDKAKRIERLAKKFELESTYDARGKAYQRMIDLDHGDILSDLYPKTMESIKNFANREGFDFILLDDRSIVLPEAGTVKDYNEAIQRKRILFAKDGMDVTDQLVTIMNNEYSASIKKSGK